MPCNAPNALEPARAMHENSEMGDDKGHDLKILLKMRIFNR